MANTHDYTPVLSRLTPSPAPPQVVFDTSKADGQFKKTASNAKLRSLRPDFRFTPIKEGIADTVKWFKEHFDTARK